MKTPGYVTIIRLSSVGDIVLATPVAAALRSAYPNAQISWVTDIHYLDLVRNNPHIDRAVGYDYLGKHRGPIGMSRLAAELKPVDLLIDLQHKVRSVLLSLHIRPTVRRVWVKRRGLQSLQALTGRKPLLRGPHQISRYLSVLEDDLQNIHDTGTCLVVPPKHKDAARNLLGNPDEEQPVVALFPGGRHATKRWPIAYMIRLADRIQAAGCNVAILGSHEERPLIDAVVRGMHVLPGLVHAGGSLGLLAGLLSLCRVVVSPDSGPAHMAGALGVATVVLFGPTSPERWAPVGPKVRILSAGVACSPCSNYGGSTCPVGTLECMQALDPDGVWQTIAAALDEVQSP